MTVSTVTFTADGSTVTCKVTSSVVTGNSAPPPAGGFFPLTAAGDWPVGPVGVAGLASLPNDAQAAAMVHRSTWEPRPTNQTANNTHPPTGWAVPPPQTATNPYPAALWNRVTGQCPLPNPTTDELIQWCAAKWGLSDEVIRAEMCQESMWYQDLKWSNSMPASVLARFGLTGRPAACPVGTPVFACGYGDYAPGSGNTRGAPSTAPGNQYNKSLGGTLIDSQFSGSRVNGAESYGIPQCRWYANTSPGPLGFGAYPWTELSTAVALDVYGASLRGQYEGLNVWMHGGYDAYRTSPGGSLGVWGSVGNWYAGDWNAALPQSQWTGKPAQVYTQDVLTFLAQKPWLKAGF